MNNFMREKFVNVKFVNARKSVLRSQDNKISMKDLVIFNDLEEEPVRNVWRGGADLCYDALCPRTQYWQY